MPADQQPSGDVTLVFSDIEGSTKLLEALGTHVYRDALAEHRRIVREAYGKYDGYEVDYEGDAFFYAFATAESAVSAVLEAMTALEEGPIRIRVGIHAGTPELDPPKYVGMDVHFAARIMSSAHGGQVVLSKATADLVEHELTELGEHRLKDIAEPVPLFQLGDGSFPPLKTISNTNLPRPASSFVGREREVGYVLERINRGARLITLTGPGGSGKTRLALEAAGTLVPKYKAGVFWVGLGSLRDATLVTETISQTLGAKDELGEHIGERELLLLLDNLEQVIEAGRELSALLVTCPNLTLLVTSRELLRVQGEVEYEVPPLAAPEAVALFSERSQLDPSGDVSELCVRLDNLPLAVELAAARTKALSPAQILERLSGRLDLLRGGRDADPRQQTLRATIEWSYELLPPHEQELFARLAIFAGGCTLEAAEEVCGADLDTLQSLVEKSLLRFSNGRYWMLETIHAYATEQLARSGAGSVGERHTTHFAALVEEAEPHLRRGDRPWIERFERELDNLRALLDRFEREGDGHRAAVVAGAMWRFWYFRSHFREGRRRLERVLALAGGQAIARGKVLHGAAVMAMNSGDLASAEQLTNEAVQLHEALGDVRGTAYSVLLLGNLNAESGRMADACPLLEESLRLFLEADEQDYALVARFNLAWAHAELNDRVRARSLHEENIVRAREIANERVEGTSLAQLAMLARTEGRLQDARRLLTSAITIARKLDDPLEIAFDLCRFASLSSQASDHWRSVQLIARADALREEIGASFEAWAVALNAETLASCRSNLGDEFAQVWDHGQRLSVDEAIELAVATAP